MGQFRVFCKKVSRQILLLRLLVIPGAAKGTRVLQFDKKSGAYHTSFNHQQSTKSPSQTQKKNVCISNGVTRWRELDSTYFVTSISARNTGMWAFFFFERRFQPLSVGGFFSHQRESISRCPKSIFPSKTQNRQILYSRKFSSGI